MVEKFVETAHSDQKWSKIAKLANVLGLDKGALADNQVFWGEFLEENASIATNPVIW